MTSQNVCTEFDLNIIEHEQHKRQHRRRRTGAKGDYVLAILVSLILQKFRKIISCFCRDFSVFSTSLPHQQYALSMNMPLSAKRSGWTLALCRRGRDWRELGKSTIVPEDHFYCRRKRGKSELKFGHSDGVKISKDRGKLPCALRARIPVIFQPPPSTPRGEIVLRHWFILEIFMQNQSWSNDWYHYYFLSSIYFKEGSDHWTSFLLKPVVGFTSEKIVSLSLQKNHRKYYIILFYVVV